MNTVKMLTLVAAAALTLSACAEPYGPNESTVKNSPAATAERAATQESEPSDEYAPPAPTSGASYVTPDSGQTEREFNEEVFLKQLSHFGVECGGDDQCLMTGEAVCQYFDEGGDEEQLFMEMANDPYDQVLPNISNDDLPYLMGSAVGALCQEHMR